MVVCTILPASLCHQVNTRVLPRFRQASAKIPPRFCQGSAKVLSRFRQELRISDVHRITLSAFSAGLFFTA